MTMADETTEPDGQAAPADRAADPRPPDGPTDPPEPEEPTPNHEAARWRARLRTAEQERDGLAERLTDLQRAEAERLAGAALSRASDLWIDGREVSDLLDDSGRVDPVRVEAEVASVLDGRPGLAVTVARPRPDHSQGHVPSGGSGSAWQEVLRAGRT
jgi:hypothetical protein